MKFIKSMRFFPAFIALLLTTLVSCEDNSAVDADLTNFVGFKSAMTVSMPTDETVQTEVTLYASNKVGSARTFDIVIDATSTTADAAYYSIPATVTIPANSLTGTFTISTTGTDIGTGKLIVLNVKDAGKEYIGKSLNISLKAICQQNKVTVQIFTDRYGSETSWEMYDSALLLIANGGPFDDASASGVYAQTPVDLCLADGDYTFVAYDAYGDGMNSGAGAGYYRLVKYDSTGAEVEIAKNGTFSTDDVVTFSLP